MALRLRRGTDAQRLLLDGISLPVPAEGELIYTTDTKKLFVGDGSTTGGVAVDVANSSLSIDNLNDVDITSTPPVGGQSLVWNASNNEFEPGDPTVLSNKSLNSLQDVDLASNAPVTGQTLKWDGLKFVPANDDASGSLVPGSTHVINIQGDVSGSVYGDDSTLIIDGTDGTVKLDNGTVEFANDQILLTGSNELKLGQTSDTFSPSLVVTNADGSPSFVSTVSGDASLGNISSSVLIKGIFGPDMTSPVAATAGDYIGQMTARGYDPTTTSYITTSSVAFRLDPAQAVATDTYKGKIEFLNQTGTGSVPALNYMTFDSDGQLAVNQQTASATLDVNGFAKLAVLTAEPASPANGMIAIADGTTWDPAGTGKSVMVVYLDGGWRTAASAP